MVKALCIIQARLNSTRLPGKSVAKVLGEKTILELCINRVRKSNKIKKIIVSTGPKENNFKINEICKKNNIDCFNSDNEENVLLRFVENSQKNPSYDWIIRVTGDNPLVGSDVIDYSIDFTLKNNLEFASCYYDKNWPNGTIVSVFSRDKLIFSSKNENLNERDKEHVIFALEKECGANVITCPNKWKAKGVRFCIDDNNDLIRIKSLIKDLNMNLEEISKISTEKIIKKITHIMGKEIIYFYKNQIDKGKFW